MMVQGKNRRCHKISVPDLTTCSACLHPIVSIRDMFRGKNRLSPPEDAVDERVSHGKTGSVHLRTPLMKGYPMEKLEMSWPYFGRTGDVHNFANVTSPVLSLNPSYIYKHTHMYMYACIPQISGHLFVVYVSYIQHSVHKCWYWLLG